MTEFFFVGFVAAVFLSLTFLPRYCDIDITNYEKKRIEANESVKYVKKKYSRKNTRKMHSQFTSPGGSAISSTASPRTNRNSLSSPLSSRRAVISRVCIVVLIVCLFVVVRTLLSSSPVRRKDGHGFISGTGNDGLGDEPLVVNGVPLNSAVQLPPQRHPVRLDGNTNSDDKNQVKNPNLQRRRPLRNLQNPQHESQKQQQQQQQKIRKTHKSNKKHKKENPKWEHVIVVNNEKKKKKKKTQK